VEAKPSDSLAVEVKPSKAKKLSVGFLTKGNAVTPKLTVQNG
jgi:hypothetical protein